MVTGPSNVLGAAVLETSVDLMGLRNGLNLGHNLTRTALNSIARDARWAGLVISASITAPLIGLGTFALRSSIQFESAFAGVRKTVDASNEQLDRLADQFRALSREIPFTAVEIARVGEVAGQLGVPVQNIQNFTRTILELTAAAPSLGLEEAATQVARFMNIMRTAPRDIDRVTSTLVELGNEGESTESEILALSLRLAGAAKFARLTEADVLSLSNALISLGLRPDVAGTAFQRIITDISKAVADNGDKLKDYADVADLSADQFAEAWRTAPAQAIATFLKGLRDLDASGQNIFKIVENLDAGEQRLLRTILTSATGVDTITESLDLGARAWAENSARVEEAAKRFATTESRLKILRNTVVDVAIDFGAQLAPALLNLVDPITQVLNLVQHLIRGFSDLPNWLKVGTLLAGAFTVALGPLMFVLGTWATGIVAIVQGYQKLTAQQNLNTAAALKNAAANTAAARATSSLPPRPPAAPITTGGTNLGTQIDQQRQVAAQTRGQVVQRQPPVQPSVVQPIGFTPQMQAASRTYLSNVQALSTQLDQQRQAQTTLSTATANLRTAQNTAAQAQDRLAAATPGLMAAQAGAANIIRDSAGKYRDAISGKFVSKAVVEQALAAERAAAQLQSMTTASQRANQTLLSAQADQAAAARRLADIDRGLASTRRTIQNTPPVNAPNVNVSQIPMTRANQEYLAGVRNLLRATDASKNAQAALGTATTNLSNAQAAYGNVLRNASASANTLRQAEANLIAAQSALTRAQRRAAISSAALDLAQKQATVTAGIQAAQPVRGWAGLRGALAGLGGAAAGIFGLMSPVGWAILAAGIAASVIGFVQMKNAMRDANMEADKTKRNMDEFAAIGKASRAGLEERAQIYAEDIANLKRSLAEQQAIQARPIAASAARGNVPEGFITPAQREAAVNQIKLIEAELERLAPLAAETEEALKRMGEAQTEIDNLRAALEGDADALKSLSVSAIIAEEAIKIFANNAIGDVDALETAIKRVKTAMETIDQLTDIEVQIRQGSGFAEWEKFNEEQRQRFTAASLTRQRTELTEEQRAMESYLKSRQQKVVDAMFKDLPSVTGLQVTLADIARSSTTETERLRREYELLDGVWENEVIPLLRQLGVESETAFRDAFEAIAKEADAFIQGRKDQEVEAKIRDLPGLRTLQLQLRANEKTGTNLESLRKQFGALDEYWELIAIPSLEGLGIQAKAAARAVFEGIATELLEGRRKAEEATVGISGFLEQLAGRHLAMTGQLPAGTMINPNFVPRQGVTQNIAAMNFNVLKGEVPGGIDAPLARVLVRESFEEALAGV